MQKTTIKDALWLTRFEIRHSLLSYLLLAIVFTILYVVPFSTFDIAERDGSMGMDYNFLFILFLLPSLIKVRSFKSTSVGNYMYVAPFHIITRQLPISRTTYIMYHFFYRFLLSVVITTVYLIILYPFWDHNLPINHYMSFILLWIALVYTAHLLDAYTQFGYHFLVWIGIIIVALPIIFIPGLLIFYIYVYDTGFVYWTFDMAGKFPLFTAIAAIAIIVFNLFFWNKLFRRKLNRTDLYY